ncbi:MAG: MFS transporter [Labilithrix sp.]|nr:MFS transporter [Labilithrix sp.]MCW5837625.1 MFS transporter [Labilithrix sp.]
MIRRPGAVLALLTGLNLLNYLDRLVVSAVLPKVQEELGLSNFQGGLLATVFLVGYFLTSPIFGSLGDRLPRRGLIAAGVLVWSLATMGSGVAGGIGSLLLARALVGVGEASYATLAPTIIDDVTPTQRKGRALAVFYMATPVGAALGYLVGGFVESRWGWRNAFLVAGGPGVLLAATCLLIAEPERKLSTEKADVLRDVKKLARVDLYRRGVLGYCAYTAAIGAFSYWAPKFLYARYALPLATANFRFGIVTVVGGAVGTILGGRWADRGSNAAVPDANAADASGDPEAARAREREAERARVKKLLKICASGSALGAPLAAGAFLSPGPTAFFVLVFLAITVLFLNTSPINAVILQAVPTELRASAMALSIFSIHIFGDLWSPPLVGLLADHVPIELAMMTLPAAIAASAWLWWPRRAAPAT